jgi:hypothetical protein
MSYAQGSLIQATDYYTLASAGGAYVGPYVGQQWGPGTGDHGMGQSISAIMNPPNNVTTGNVVTAVQWTGLIQTINSCMAHQGHAAITPTSVIVGTPASYFASISAGSALAYASAGTTGLALTDSVTYPASYSGTWGQTGSQTLVATHTVAFASADAARYFFNAGGKLKLSFARTLGTVSGGNSLENIDWTNLCAACGSIQIGYKNTTQVGNSGSPSVLLNSNNGGYWNLNTAYNTQFRQMSGAGGGYYGSEIIKVDVAWSGTPANGGYPTLLIRTTFDDSFTASYVDGNTSATLVVSSPATTYITNTWGNPSVSTSIAPI